MYFVGGVWCQLKITLSLIDSVNPNHLIKLVYAKFLYSEVTIFPLQLIDILEEKL